MAASQAQQIASSSNTLVPVLPPGAWDSHVHVVDEVGAKTETSSQLSTDLDRNDMHSTLTTPFDRKRPV
jgi:hypothetical protein